MPWMRVAIGVGAAGLLAGVFGMVTWIDDGSRYFEVAVAVGSAGFLTLVACVLTQVFGSSHGSQDDAFRRGKSMGYDEGFLAGRRTARPVVVPMPFATHAAESLTSDDEPEPEIPPSSISRVKQVSSMNQVSSISHQPKIAAGGITHQAKIAVGGVETGGVEAVDVDAVSEETPLTAITTNRSRHIGPLMSLPARRSAVEWVCARRIPLVGGALCLLMVGVLAASAFVDVSMPPAGASNSASGTQSNQAEPPTGTGGWSTKVANPAMPGVTVPAAGLPGAAVAQISPLARGKAGGAPAAATLDANGNVVPVPASVRAPGAASLTPSAVSLPIVYTPALTPLAAPTQAAPAVPLTAAQQTAKNAADAAALTAANAARDAALTAANAAEAARITAANAAAASAATAAQAKTDACAVKGKVC